MADFKFAYPEILMPSGGAPAFQTHTLDAPGDLYTVVFRTWEPMVVTSVSFRQGTVTGNPDSLRVGLQEVDTTTGLANGTWLGGVSNFATLTVTTAANNSFVTATLPTSVTLIRGQVVAMVLDPTTGGGGGNGWDANDLLNVSRSIANATHNSRGPYGIDNTTRATVQNFVFKINTSTKTYGLPIETITARSVGTGTSPAVNEWGMYFRIPTTVCASYKVEGVRIGGVPSLADWRLRLYDTNGTTVLQQVLVDKDELHLGTAYVASFYWDDSTLATLNAGSYYRIAFAPTTATATGAVYSYDLDLAIDRGCFIGDPADMSATERRDGGAWTETDTRLWVMQALICDVTAPTGSAGGMLVHTGMSGGIRG
jgi:hypothetical protein